MLFDLRGRGRRRTVQVIYLGLALLIGAGLVFFGVGAGVGGGGLLNSLTGNEGSSSASFSAQIEKYKKLTQKQPNNVYAWEQLTLAQLHEAGGEAYVTRTGLTSKGRELFSQTAQSWNGYIALNPPKPNAELAQEMVRVFGEEGLNQPAEAVKILQIVIPAKHESTPAYQASLYTSLAVYAYQAHNVNTGDLAAQKALALAPAEQRKRLKTQLAEAKKRPSGTEYTTTGANGEVIKAKPGPNGTLTGTAAAPATTQPSGLTTTKKK
ncbi:MAG TPA: hypothetical protein VES65_08685 [Solirubrobacteraceae bacterium]|nr:hypothetical protein [Solirubrobacteraceae bacterium]